VRLKSEFFWVLGASLALSATHIALAQEDPLHIVAAAVRENGYACDTPKSVAPDMQDTSPDEKAWIIDCGNSKYRVKFVGDASVEVSAVDG
jgi:hypothetical protein